MFLKYMAVVFDFDLTLTTIHTGGVPKLDVDYFGPERLKKVIRLFQDIKAEGLDIYINTRGVTSMVANYIRHWGLEQYVEKVYGARNMRELNADDWPQRKVRVLQRIQHRYPGHAIYFYDDTRANLVAALAVGFMANILVL